MRATEFLLEYNQQITAQNYGAALIDAGTKDPYIRLARDEWCKQFLEAAKNIETKDVAVSIILNKIEEIDPTPHKEYVQWLAKIFASKTTKWEDLQSRGADALTRFNRLKIKKVLAPEHKDIGKFKTLSQLEAIMDNYPDVDNVPVQKGKAIEYYKDADLRVIVPQDETAACYYGQGTKWCTAAKKNNMFNDYNKEGPLYIIIPTKTSRPGKKYQFHFETGQFMDDSDNPIDLNSFVKEYPQLKTIFHEQAKKNLTIPLLNNAKELYEQFEIVKKQVFPFAHKTLMYNLIVDIRELRKEFVTYYAPISIATELTEITWDTINKNSHSLVSSVLSHLTPDSLQGDDDLWDTVYSACEDWVSSSEIGEYAVELESKHGIDGYGMVTNIVDMIYQKMVVPTAAKLKQELQNYIK